MKIWIVYDSKFGNNKKVVQKMQELLGKNHEVHVNYAKEISPKNVLAASPEIFLFGGPRRIGKISKTLRKWVERFSKLLKMNKPNTWEERVKYALNHQDSLKATREEKAKIEFYKKLKMLVPIHLVLGIVAAYTMYRLYGGDLLIRTVLSWLIGLTLMGTIIAYLPKHIKK